MSPDTDEGNTPCNERSPGSPGVLTEEQALHLIAFLTSAAEISIHEPTYYGTFRLVDAASRMIGMMLENGPEPPRSGPFLRDLKTEIDTKKVWMMWDRDAYFDFLRATPGQVAREVKRLADADEVGAPREEGQS